MSTSAEVAVLEDVFAKTSMPIQSTQSGSQETTVITGSSTNVLSEFTDAVLAPPEELKKADEINASVLSNSVELTEEIQDVLTESTIVENTGLDPVVETTKTVTETASTAVTGSVELAEEIMEAFANSKNVLDTENTVSNDPCALQEELERLDQLAVERVREIEGELVNSTKQITECNVSLDAQKKPKSAKMTEKELKEFEPEMVVPNATDTSAKEVGESLCSNIVTTIDLTSPAELLSVIPEISSANVDVKEKEIKSSSNIDLLESTANSAEAREKEPGVLIPENSELIDINALESEKSSRSESKNVNTIAEQRDKIENTILEVQEERNSTVSNLDKAKSSDSKIEAGVNKQGSEFAGEMVNILSDIEGKTNLSEKKNAEDCLKSSGPSGEREIAKNEGKKKKLLGENVECSSSTEIHVTQENILKKHYSSDKSGASKDDSMKSANRSIVQTGDATTTKQVVEDGKKIKDIQNYETEDDDLEVLEAFIVKTATNPELAVCTVQPSKNDDSVSKYSLESALLDDLTKTDNGSSINEIENRSDMVSKDSSFAKSAGGGSGHEKPKEMTSLVDSSGTQSKVSGNAIEIHVEKQANSVSERKLSEKKCTMDKSSDEIASKDNEVKESNKKTGKKVVFVEVKRRSRRPVISGKKTLSAETSSPLRKESSIKHTVSEKSFSEKGVSEVRQDQSPIKRNIRNSKKLKVDEESVPLPSDVVSGQKVAEHSGVSKKKHMEQNTDSTASISKTSLKNNENKGESRPATSVKIVETSSKEKKKPKDIKLNNDNKPISHSDLESVSDKRNVENCVIVKPGKKDEKRLKENIETPTTKNVKGGSSNSDATNSRSTRNAKKTVTAKSALPMNLNEHTKEKDKENVEKLNDMSVGGGDSKSSAERILSKENSLKNEKSQSQKRHRSLSEDARDAKKKNNESLQASAAVKHSRGGRDVEGLSRSVASTAAQKRAEEDSDQGSPSPKAPLVTSTKKTTERESLLESGTLLKRKRVEKETEDISSDIQLSPTLVKRKRGETEGKEISAGKLTPPNMLKRKRADIEIMQSSHTMQISQTMLESNRVEREFEQIMPNVGIEFAHVTLSDSNSTEGTLCRVYSDTLFVEYEEITFDMLRSKAKQLVLPTPLWGAQVSSEKDLVAFSRLCADLSDDKPMIDKALVFQGSLKPIALINNEPVDLPIPCIRTFEDVVMLIRNFHTVSFCEGTGVKQRPQSKSCFRYLDIANPGGRCSQCLEERRRVLFGCARKLRERINGMKAAKSHQ